MRPAAALIPLILGLLTACSNVERSMVFFTNTTIGVEVSADAASNTPVKAVLGYKRAEGVINPVYDENGVEFGGTTGKRYRDEAYSVLAKVHGEASAGAGPGASGRISGGQWFATGEAATVLARQPGIAGAISGSPDIAEAEAKARSFAQGGGNREAAGIGALRAAYTALKVLAGKGDQLSLKIKSNVDAPAASLHGEYPFSEFQYDSASKSLSERTRVHDPDAGFHKVLDYWSTLSRSLKSLESYVTHHDDQPSKPADLSQRRNEASMYRALRDAFAKEWGSKPEVLALADWYWTYLKAVTE